MDFLLEPFQGTLAGRILHHHQEFRDREVGETRLICSGCGDVVGRNIPLRGILKVVFKCDVCGVLSVVGPSTPRRQCHAD